MDDMDDENPSTSGDAMKERDLEVIEGKISYRASIPRTEAVSYFEAIIDGLKKGRVEFRQDDETVAMQLPNRVGIEVKAKQGDKKGKISFEITWKNGDSPEFAIVSD